ncbi:MAG: carbamate kinase [Chloroflexi bacterium]|nr:carbamate kinase [Chloroflexota bacterium]MCY4246985.1 carbamate kinase [Chloroflexota bacterium]
MEKLVVVAIGGNSLIADPAKPDTESQWESVRETCRHIAAMTRAGWQVVVTHGNGPQVGYIMNRAEIATRVANLHGVPLDLAVADTQGSIGYMLQQALANSLRREGMNHTVATIITQICVDPDDPAFANPDKPVGGYMTEAEALAGRLEGWQVRKEAGRGWRRVVASPKPIVVNEINAIQALVLAGYIVIVCGGGGVPVVRNEVGSLRGVDAVIDKDRASSLLAQTLRADLLLISTGVEKACLNFRTSQQQPLDELTLAEARRYLNEGQFPPGSMYPKIESAIDFVHNGGPRAIITDPPNITRALHHQTGTRIVPGGSG